MRTRLDACPCECIARFLILYMSHYTPSPLDDLVANVTHVVHTLHDTLQAITERGHRLRDVVLRSETLRTSASYYRQRSRILRYHERLPLCCQCGCVPYYIGRLALLCRCVSRPCGASPYCRFACDDGGDDDDDDGADRERGV